MHIRLHEPMKGAKALFVPWHVRAFMALAIAWMWIRKKVYKTRRNCGTTFNPVDRYSVIFDGKVKAGMLILVDFDWVEHHLVKVEMEFEYVKIRLWHDGVRFTASNCKEHITFLGCGCSHKWLWLSSDAPFREKQERCVDCGKYHKGERQESDIYEDCKTHRTFFERWPDANRGYYDQGDCPQIKGLSPLDAFYLLNVQLEQGSLARDRQEELCQAISRNDLDSYEAIKLTGLDPDLRDRLVNSVAKSWQARNLLEEYRNGKLDLGLQAIHRLERTLLIRKCLVWTMRMVAAMAAITVWLWHFPDWRTIVVLTATAACAMIGTRIKSWLK